MGFFLRSGTTYRSTSQAKLDLQPELPPKVFSVAFDSNRGEYYLDEIEEMPVPAKTYGGAEKNAARIVSTFIKRNASTGILLVGEKGSGKTLLSKLVCRRVQQEYKMPVIVINQPFCGDTFNSFIQSIEQPCALLFDEFEKVYSQQEKREAMLTLLDGVYPSKKLFLLTANNKWAIDTNMRNRPGRVFYMLEFGGLERDFVMDYAVENLEDPTAANGVVKASLLFSKFNFDMLKALVEEMNRYSESAMESLKFLNIKPDWEQNEGQRYTITTECKNKDGEVRKLTQGWRGNPLVTPIEFEFYDREEGESYDFTFDIGDIQRMDAETGQIIYSNEEATVFVDRVKPKESFNWAAV